MEEINIQKDGKIGNKKKIIIVIFLMAIFFAGYLAGQYMPFSKEPGANRQVRQSGYKFINPLLECEVENLSQGKMLVSFRSDLEKLISDETGKKNVSTVSVYFRDLNNGPWFGISENEEFTPASLLKVPLAIAYFNESELNPGVLSREIKFEKSGEASSDLMQNIVPKQKMEPGKSYAVQDLIERMIIYSDNDAAVLLLENINQNTLNKTYSDLGLKVPNEVENGGNMTVVSYASFFRILFNASYLNKQNSEKLLEILSRSDFKDGLVAGIPSNIGVSHKFGEREISDQSGATRQLHDCGIVYYPEHPYLLCVMTKGNDFKTLAGVIKEVSQRVYGGMEREYKK